MSTSSWKSITTTLLLVAVVGVLVAWLRATAPTSTTDTAVEVPPGDALTCEELASDVPAGRTGGESVGRVTSGAVLSCPAEFDALLVTYVGEVVGDVLARDGGSWLLVNDDRYALHDGPLTAGGTPSGTNSGLTVWLPDPLDELADQPGRAEVRGDVLEVIGRVHRADPADGGGLTIRAEQATVLAEAVTVEAPVHWRQVGAAAVLAVLALLMLWREREQRSR